MTIIMGIDPGSRNTGFGIIGVEGKTPHYISSGTIRLPTKSPLSDRLKVLFESLSEIIATHRPSEVAVEAVFMAKSADSALKLGHARGVVIVACVINGLAVYEYAARQIKKSVVGTGAASKTQVQHMVSLLLDLSSKPKEDAADGLAAALCHTYSHEVLTGVSAVAFRSGRVR